MEVQGLIQSNLSFRVLPSYVTGLLYIRDFLKLSLTPIYHGYDILERTNDPFYVQLSVSLESLEGVVQSFNTWKRSNEVPQSVEHP